MTMKHPDKSLQDFINPEDAALTIADTPMPDIPAGMPLRDQVKEVLKTIYDPEIPVSIWELGLIYAIEISPDNVASLKMTLTAPACPVAGSMPGIVAAKIKRLSDIKDASVELVWSPPWSRSMMSEAALLELGLY